MQLQNRFLTYTYQLKPLPEATILTQPQEQKEIPTNALADSLTTVPATVQDPQVIIPATPVHVPSVGPTANRLTFWHACVLSDVIYFSINYLNYLTRLLIMLMLSENNLFPLILMTFPFKKGLIPMAILGIQCNTTQGCMQRLKNGCNDLSIHERSDLRMDATTLNGCNTIRGRVSICKLS